MREETARYIEVAGIKDSVRTAMDIMLHKMRETFTALGGDEQSEKLVTFIQNNFSYDRYLEECAAILEAKVEPDDLVKLCQLYEQYPVLTKMQQLQPMLVAEFGKVSESMTAELIFRFQSVMTAIDQLDDDEGSLPEA